jgi:hypothetical protein
MDVLDLDLDWSRLSRPPGLIIIENNLSVIEIDENKKIKKFQVSITASEAASS